MLLGKIDSELVENGSRVSGEGSEELEGETKIDASVELSRNQNLSDESHSRFQIHP